MPTRRGEAMLSVSGAVLARIVGRWRAELGDDLVGATLTTLARVDHGGRSVTDVSDRS